jgi:hypothetical protein
MQRQPAPSPLSVTANAKMGTLGSLDAVAPSHLDVRIAHKLSVDWSNKDALDAASICNLRVVPQIGATVALTARFMTDQVSAQLEVSPTLTTSASSLAIQHMHDCAMYRHSRRLADAILGGSGFYSAMNCSQEEAAVHLDYKKHTVGGRSAKLSALTRVETRQCAKSAKLGAPAHSRLLAARSMHSHLCVMIRRMLLILAVQRLLSSCASATLDGSEALQVNRANATRTSLRPFAMEQSTERLLRFHSFQQRQSSTPLDRDKSTARVVQAM